MLLSFTRIRCADPGEPLEDANPREMFEPGKEVIAYRSPEECVELVQYYLDHEEERVAVAAAGQRRTLRDHTYHQRMQELVSLVQKRR